MTESAQPIGLGAVSVPRPADVFAETLRHRILDGDIPVGSMLPAERQLVEDSGLTRSAVREALAQLQREGLIAVRTGRRGGSVVTRPTASEVLRSVRLNLEGWAPSSEMLMESRVAIEPWCAYFAAERRSEGDLAELREINERTARALEGHGDFVECKVAWHSAVSRAGRNEVLFTLVEAVSRAAYRQFDRTTLQGEDADSRLRSLQVHEAVTDAIARQKPGLAFKLMGNHLNAPSIVDEFPDGPVTD
ncbi:FCD domain-containing protein [Gordonia rubripertincta]|uniref:FCD domain-containing protein n=1 Tax=Gordonia rubripertincta TaxID=36822 RepID=A0AAW6RCR5_GORRU|nr:FCD domain-containing protein [Gordonia rubripertincta]MDG6782403.1 FCD domain-containing protein [Gordonia rubripertincta]NKY64500.1 FadR family transcriptional regulator [Gordonia rubripertincta]